MKDLLVFVALVAPVLAAAQTPYHLYGHAQRFTLYKPLRLYQCLDDTPTARPLRLDPGQVITLKAYVNHQWSVLQQYIGYTPVNFYVRSKDLAIMPYNSPATGSKRRRKRLL